MDKSIKEETVWADEDVGSSDSGKDSKTTLKNDENNASPFKKSGLLKSIRKRTLKGNKKDSSCNSTGLILNQPVYQRSPSLFSESQDSKAESPSLTRSLSDSAVRNTRKLVNKGSLFRQSFGIASKKQPLLPVSETVAPAETQNEAIPTPKVKKTFNLPKIPPVPLAVMEINKLIEMDDLENAYVNLLSLRQEHHQEFQALGQQQSPTDLLNKEKDLKLLFNKLKSKMASIVGKSSALSYHNKEPLVHVASIILEEEKRQKDPVWREGWREAVLDGVRDVLKNVHLNSQEKKGSWLANHLGLLGKAVVENLECVKTELQDFYPPDFNVFETYVSCHHVAMREHLKSLGDKIADLRDYHTLLDFIMHRYSSEKIMGSVSLQPEMREDQRTLSVEEDFLDRIKDKYCSRLQNDITVSLLRIVELENEEMWKEQRKPEKDEGLYCSHIDMDIWTKIKGHVQGARSIDGSLEKKVVRSCLLELKSFPKSFEVAFVEWNSAVVNTALWTEYHISYINSFSALKKHMDCYRDSCPLPLQQVGLEIDGLTKRLKTTLMEHFKSDVKPFLRRQMTRKWFSVDEDFTQLMCRTRALSEHTQYMSPEHKQAFVNEAHFFLVKEYISQLMKNNYRCKNRKNETAASKITQQWTELQGIFKIMHSTLDWLHPVGAQLSKIIGSKKVEVKEHLQPLVENYPDFRRSHLSAVLFFRGIVRGRERQVILQRMAELKGQKEKSGDNEHALFSEIQPVVNTDCLAGMPFSCMSFIIPERRRMVKSLKIKVRVRKIKIKETSPYICDDGRGFPYQITTVLDEGNTWWQLY